MNLKTNFNMKDINYILEMIPHRYPFLMIDKVIDRKAKSNIQTIKNNETRFVVLERSTPNSKSVFNKASIKFELDHKRGSLATILNVLSDCKMNLTKIQSMPKIETPWRYSFFVDITFESLDDYFKAKSIIEIMAKDFKVLGEYKNSKND